MYHDLVCEAGAIYECLDTTGATCGTCRPSGACNSDSLTWAVPTEAGLESPPASKEVKLVSWTPTTCGAGSECTDVDYAFETGSIATTREGGMYTCDPATASFGSLPFDIFWNMEIADPDGTAYRNVVAGCANFSPSSEKGKLYWIDNSADGAVVDTSNLTPQWIIACPYTDEWFYIPGDFATSSLTNDDGSQNETIYECWDVQYCHNDPTSAIGF